MKITPTPSVPGKDDYEATSYIFSENWFPIRRLTVVKFLPFRRTVGLPLYMLLFFLCFGFSDRLSAEESQTNTRTINQKFTLDLWRTIGLERDVDWKLLFAISLQESQQSSKSVLHPWPWAVNSNGGGCFCKNYDEAVETIEQLIADGYTSIDVGLMQINMRWHGHRVNNDYKKLLIPSVNLAIGADVLRDAMRSTDSWHIGVGRYHSWKPEKGDPYANKVRRFYNAIDKLDWS